MTQSNIDALTQQILAQNTTSKWSGEGFGSAEANAADMAKILDSIGITDIKQFGQFEKTTNEQQRVVAETNSVYPGYGDTNIDIPTGRYYIPRYAPENDGMVLAGKTYVDPSTVTKQTVVYGDNDETYYVASVPKTQTVYGNKVTGQAVPNTYSERQTGNAWGGTFAGSGNTGYRVQFDSAGNPYFYTTGASSSDLAGIAPLIGIGLMFVPGLQAVGASVGAAVAGGASVATQAIIGNALVQGVIAEATGGDFVKGAVSGAIGASGISGAVSDIVGGGVVGAAAGQAATSGVVAAVSGGDIGQALVQGAVSGAINYVPPAQGINSQITPAQIESGLGTEGYGTSAAAQTSELFDSSKIGAGAYVQPPLSGDYSVTPDYSLFPESKTPSLSEMGGAQGIQEPALPEVLESNGTVDYSLAPQVGGEPSLQMPDVPNLESMGGAQGITVPVDGGTMTESGLISDNYTPNLGDSTSFINQPAPGADVSDVVNQAVSNVEQMPAADSKLSAKDAAKFLKAVMGITATGTVVDQVLSASDMTKSPSISLNYGDIYKDAPIKGFSMQKMQDDLGATKYMPKIYEKELLSFDESFKPVAMAKGGFVQRRV